MKSFRDASLKQRLFAFPASLIVIGLMLLSLTIYVSQSYASLVKHLHHEDIQLLSEISQLSAEFEDANVKLLSIFDEKGGKPEDVYSVAFPLLDNLNVIVDDIDTLIKQTKLHGDLERFDHVIEYGPLKQTLEDYLNTIAVALEQFVFDPTKSNDFIQKSLSKSTIVNQQLFELNRKLVAHIKKKIEVESSHLSNLTFWALLFASLIVLVTVAANSKAAISFSSSINSIRTALLELAAGNLKVEIPKEHEIPELITMSNAVDAYKKAQIELNRTLGELSDIKLELESRVKQRTEALKLSNAQLLEEVSEHKRSQDKLKIYAKALHSTSEAVIITNAKNFIVEVNDAYCDISGYSREEILGKAPGEFKSGQHDEEFYQQFWRDIEEKGAWQGEIWDRRKDGEVYPKWLTINRVLDHDGNVTNYVGVFTDISDIKQKEAQLERLAHFDPLTQLPNRMLCRERISQKLKIAQREGNKVAVLFIDLDRFKLINDTLGHAAGDQLLQQIANRLESSLRADDMIMPATLQLNHTIARLGGDEFIISLGNLISVDYVADIVERLQEIIREPINLCDQEVYVDSSVGIAIYPDDGEDFETLCRNADAAMYRAKELGKGQFVLFTEKMNTLVHQRLQLEIEMKNSLAEKHFELHYQPKLYSLNKRIHSIEALVRWNHPELGVIQPGEFIEVSEETGMIVPLGAWVLEEACRFCAELNNKLDEPIQVAVNISPRQFQDPELLKKVASALDHTGLPSHCLELEITESTFFDDIDLAIEVINEIRQLGVKFALDDFGTGYSSLSHLKQLPVDTLKLDRSFISQIDEVEHGGRNIVGNVILLGQQFNMITVAEGVETVAQEEYLIAKGCNLLQGYLYSKPLEARELTKYLSKFTSIQHS